MPRRSVVLLISSLLVAAACGSRLSDEQRTLAIEAAAGTVDGTGQPRSGGDVGLGAGDGSVGGATRGSGRDARGGGSSRPGGGAGPANVDNGGATDTGVTRNQVVIANIADVTGPSPGLFKAAPQAVQAWTAYVNSGGGIHGRQVRLLALDSRTDTGGNREASTEACENAFALVGSMSAFDSGGTETVDRCGIPDVSAIPTQRDPARAGGVSFPAYPNRPDVLIMGTARYIKSRYPDAIRRAAMLYLNTSTTIAYANLRRAAYESIGFEFVVFRQVQVVEPNYLPYVLEMRGRDVDYVTMVADINSIVQMLKAARSQGFRPAVFDFDSVVYNPQFAELAGPAAEGLLFYLNNVMLEEASSNPELRLYESWLARAVPGARPDFFGLWAWSAARLFERALRESGPRATREALIRKLQTMHSWSGNGLHPPNDIGRRLAAPCYLYAQLTGGRFVRRHPARGYVCNPGDYYVR